MHLPQPAAFGEVLDVGEAQEPQSVVCTSPTHGPAAAHSLCPERQSAPAFIYGTHSSLVSASLVSCLGKERSSNFIMKKRDVL